MTVIVLITHQNYYTLFLHSSLLVKAGYVNGK